MGPAYTPADHDIEADWTLFQTCNFVCDYCFFSPQQLHAKRVDVASNAAWQAAYDGTGLRWLIHLTGGEPSLLPGFVDLCQRLTQRHRISLNTNLSRSVFNAFAGAVDPASVYLIHASFHPDERFARRGDAMFIDNAQRLRDAGFRLLVSVVATPDVLTRFDAIRARLGPAGISPVPKLLRGWFKGRSYPADYSAPDRARFVDEMSRSREENAALVVMDARFLTINPFQDAAYLEALPDFSGQRCGSGRTFVTVDPFGVVRSCPDSVMGSLLDGTFCRTSFDSVCRSHYCHYWCLRHVRREATVEPEVPDGWAPLVRPTGTGSSRCPSAPGASGARADTL